MRHIFYVGIDWIDKRHHVYATYDSSQKLNSFQTKHDTSGMNKLQEHIHKSSPKLNNVLFSLETDRDPIIITLMDWGYTACAINQKPVDRCRASGVKSDEFDACMLANILRTHGERFQPIPPDSQLAREVKVSTRDREKLVGDRTRLSNRLTSTLKDYYPAALELFCHIDQPITLSFLDEYPTNQGTKRITFGEFKAFLSENRCPDLKKAKEVYRRLQQPHLEPEDMIARTKSRLMLAIVSQLQLLIQQIKAYEEEVKRLLDCHPDAHIFRCLPGAGDNLSARFIAEFSDDHDRYQKVVNAQAETSPTPKTIQSGKMKYVKFPRACKKPFRATIHQFALCNIPGVLGLENTTTSKLMLAKLILRLSEAFPING